MKIAELTQAQLSNLPYSSCPHCGVLTGLEPPPLGETLPARWTLCCECLNLSILENGRLRLPTPPEIDDMSGREARGATPLQILAHAIRTARAAPRKFHPLGGDPENLICFTHEFSAFVFKNAAGDWVAAGYDRGTGVRKFQFVASRTTPLLEVKREALKRLGLV